MTDNSCNRVKVSSSALRNNFRFLQRSVNSGVAVMAMVKADGYGHGMVNAARVFSDAGCMAFGVAELREAVILRKAGIGGSIYVTMAFGIEDVGLFFKYDLIPVIYDYNAALALSRKAVESASEITVHIKVDTGMGRLGVFADELPRFIDGISALAGVKIGGFMSHFPEADTPEKDSTDKGYDLFSTGCINNGRCIDTICHIANSSAVLNFPKTHCDMVRVGIALYGYHPAGKVDQTGFQANNLLPALSFTSRILQVKLFPAGAGISYGYTYRTSEPRKIAVLPVGYEDGFSRRLSNRATVLIGGRRVPVVGRICMNMCMVDVTSVVGVKSGDEVVFIGRQGSESINADDIAKSMGTISYEVLCLFGNNNNRIYVE